MTNHIKLVRITTISRSLSGLLKGQFSFMSQYFDVIAISGGGIELEKVRKEEGVRVASVKMERDISLIRDFISLINLIKLFLKEKPEIVHTHTPKAGLLGMIAAWCVRVPVRIHTVAGLPLMEKSGFKKRILNLMEKITYKCAHKVYPNSLGLKKYILENNLTKGNKLQVIGNGSSNGINLSYYDSNRISDELANNTRRNLGIAPDDFIFIYIGRVVKDKGVEELITAFKKLSDEYSHIKLLILGKYEEELDPVSDYVKDTINTNENIIFTGFQADIRPFLKVATVLVHPSYREGFPNVVMQAGAMNIPSIVTDINGSNEIIKDKVNGFIIPLKNELALFEKMKYLYKNQDILFNLKSCCREMIANRYEQSFVWNEILKEYKAFEELLD